MTGISKTPPVSTESDAPGSESVSFPAATLAILTVSGCVAVGALGWLLVSFLAPRSAIGVLEGVAIVLVATLVALGLVRPARARPRSQWPMILFGAQGAALVLTIAGAGALLYFSPPPGPAWLAGASAGAFITVWILLGKRIGIVLGSPSE